MQDKIRVVFFKNQQLTNEVEFPICGWLFSKGESLKGIHPIIYNSKTELANAVERYRGKESKLYFDIAQQCFMDF